VIVGVEHLDLSPFAGGEMPSAATTRAEPDTAPLPLADRIEAYRRREILAAVERQGGNWAAAARELGLHRSNLHHLATRLGLRRR